LNTSFEDVEYYVFILGMMLVTELLATSDRPKCDETDLPKFVQKQIRAT